MWINFIAVIILILVVFIGFTGYSFAKDKTENLSGGAFNQLSKINLNQQLSDLEAPSYNYKDEVSAMCYSRAPDADMRAEYSCPACHNITLYTSPFSNYDVERIFQYRVEVKKIKNIDVKLDESEFCRTCSPNVKNPKLYLIVNYNEKAKDHRTQLIRIDDIKILQAFSEGKKTYTMGLYNAEFPLKNQEKRLEELLGVDVDL